ncbi:MAG: hypothetical protein ACE5JS_21325 [Nitrospinota bacterium]
MPYAGQTYRIPANRGGWNANPNADLIPPESMVEARNINLHRGGRETRGGVAKVNGTAIPNGPRITGIFQFRKKDGSEFIVTTTADGKIQKDYSTELKTGLTANKISSFAVFKDQLYICNGADRPQVWDGVAATTSDITNIPTDWTGTAWPKAMIVHGRGASESLWAWGVPGLEEKIYVSQNGADNFSDAQVTILSIETGDGFGIVALAEYLQTLVAFGKRRSYIIDDESTDRTQWGYNPARWDGGAASNRLVVRTPNDLVAMQEDGEIYSVVRAQEVLDLRAVSIARPAHIHVWIGDNVDLSQIDDFHMIYDPALRAILFFVIRNGESRSDSAMAFFIDRPAEEAWVNRRYYKNYFASSSGLVRVAAGDWRIYLGGYTGFAWKLEDESFLDDGEYYYSGFTTPELAFEDPRGEKQFDRAHLVLRRMGSETIQAHLFVDGDAIVGGFFLVDENGNNVVDESGNLIIGYEFDPYTFQMTAPPPLTSPQRLSSAQHAIGRNGRRIQSEIFQTVAGERMFVAQILYDFKPLGPEPR